MLLELGNFLSSLLLYFFSCVCIVTHLFIRTINATLYLFRPTISVTPYLFRPTISTTPYFFRLIFNLGPYFFKPTISITPCLFRLIISTTPQLFKLITSDPSSVQIDTSTQLDLPSIIPRGRRGLCRPRLLPPLPSLFPAPVPSQTDVLHVSHAVPVIVRDEHSKRKMVLVTHRFSHYGGI